MNKKDIDILKKLGKGYRKKIISKQFFPIVEKIVTIFEKRNFQVSSE